MKKNLFILFFIPMIFGCAQVATYNVTELKPANLPGKTSEYMGQKLTYAVYAGDNFRAAAAGLEYNNYIIAFNIRLINLTTKDVEGGQYKIELFDGRDMKSVRLLTRDELQAVKNTMAGGSSSGAIQDQLINTSVNTVMSAIDAPTKNKLVGIIQYGVDNYFSFRPVWARDKRDGILCFMPNFKLEYPLTLRIRYKNRTADLKFIPKKG